MRDVSHLVPTAAKMSGIFRKLFVIAIVVPVLLFAAVATDGISGTDIGVTAFVTVILWLFVGITRFTVGAMAQMENPPETKC
jgi:hypothetical protein